MKITLTGVLALCLLLALPGCARSRGADTSVAETTPTVETTPSVEVTPVVQDLSSPNEGLPVVNISDKTRAAGNPDRPVLLDAARKAAGLTGQFYVWQLYIQGTTAVGDLQETKSATRTLFAFERDGAGWRVVHQKPFLDASEAELLESAPSITQGLAEYVDFVVPVPVNEFFVKNAPALRAFAAEWGLSITMHAPTRLPEGFVLEDTIVRDQNMSAWYRNGSARIVVWPLIYGDYGEKPPQAIFDNVRFGSEVAFMDSSYWLLSSDSFGEEGPMLLGPGGYQVVEGANVSPGMVAAVAQSMVRVD